MSATSIILSVVDAMADDLRAHDWATVTPKAVLTGPVPPGWLDLPAIGVMATDARANAEHTTARYADVTELVLWELAEALDLDGLEAQWRKHVEWRSEAVRLARKAAGGYWGTAGVRASQLVGWGVSLAESAPPAGGIAYVVTTILQMEVSYREQF